MFKKMTLLAMAVGALVAFAAPAVAQANVYLYEINAAEEEVVLGNNAGVTATSTDLVTTLEGGGQLECELVTLHLQVQTNGQNHVVLKQLGEATTTNCKLNVGTLLSATITDGTLGTGIGQEHKITINTWGTGTTGGHFKADIPAAGLECELDGSVHVLGTNGTDILHVGPSALTATGTGCHNGTIEGSFTTETSNGTPVYLHSVTT